MTLTEKKFENYTYIRNVLFDIETILNQNGFRFYDLETVQDLMKMRIKDEFQIVSTLEFSYVHGPARVFCETDTGYSISMIAPESRNEEDPIKDVLDINTIEDIFRAKSIIDKAFLELVAVKE